MWFFDERFTRRWPQPRRHAQLLKEPSSVACPREQAAYPSPVDDVVNSEIIAEPERVVRHVQPDNNSNVDARPRGFSATLEESDNVMVVDDVRVLSDGSIALYGRSSNVPLRPKSC